MRHNTMKWLGSLLLLVVLAAGCGAMRQSAAERKAEGARVATAVRQMLDGRHYTIHVDFMNPTRGAGRNVGGEGYSLTVNGDKVNSHLPYVGVSTSVPYGGGKVLTFEDDIDEYKELQAASDRRVFVFTTDNDEDVITFELTVFDNGQADILVRSRNREQISFRGELDTEADK